MDARVDAAVLEEALEGALLRVVEDCALSVVVLALLRNHTFVRVGDKHDSVESAEGVVDKEGCVS